eukprot:gene27919-6287_t
MPPPPASARSPSPAPRPPRDDGRVTALTAERDAARSLVDERDAGGPPISRDHVGAGTHVAELLPTTTRTTVVCAACSGEGGRGRDDAQRRLTEQQRETEALLEETAAAAARAAAVPLRRCLAEWRERDDELREMAHAPP